MTEQRPWHQARLIPTSGINGADEQERRATSALLAVMGSVKEFGRALTQRHGAIAGQITTYIEVPFLLGERRVIPDGLIQVSRGSRQWIALVEVKTGNNTLAAPQIEDYLDVAREQGFDAVVTISNEVPAIAGTHPTKVDKRKLRKVALHHMSWTLVLAEAVMQKEFRGVADPDQAWILGELIRYLEHPRSGALEFDDMGDSWVSVRDAVGAGTLRGSDKGVAEVATRFDALLQFVSLRLGRQLGTEVAPALSRKELADPSLRRLSLVESLVSDGQLIGSIRIPETVGPLIVTADLRAGQITCHVDIDAPKEGRPTTRVNWLTRQLKDAPETTRIEAFVAHTRRSSAAELLRHVRADPTVLLTDPGKELRSFRIATRANLGPKRGRGRGAFIDSVLVAVDAFYGDVMQHLRQWTTTPPKLRAEADRPLSSEQDVPAPLVSTALSSQDGVEAIPPEAPSASASAPPGTTADSVTDDAVRSVLVGEAPGGRHEPAALLAKTDEDAPLRLSRTAEGNADGEDGAQPGSEHHP